MKDATGQKIWQGDTVTLLNPSSWSDGGNHCAAVLGGGRPGPNKLLVRRVDGSKATVNASDVRVADRSFMQPHMVVMASTDIDCQLGLVMSAATELDLARLNGGDAPPAVVARGVSPAAVRRAGGEFIVGDYVVSAAAGAAWLGCVVDVCRDVDVVFADGARCRVALEDTRQRAGGPQGVFRAARWLKGYRKDNHGEGTMARVETTAVVVHWIASAPDMAAAADESEPLPPPPNLQSPRDLTFFCRGRGNIFHQSWGVGDRCLFRGDANDHHPSSAAAATTAGCGRKLTRRDWRKLWMRRRPSRRQRFLDDSRPLAVASTRTTVDVLWQDGTRQRGVPSASVVLWAGETDNDLIPGQRVVRRTTEPPKEEEEDERVGVVRGYSYKDKTVRVSWDRLESETLSAYDVVVSRPHDIYYGDIVVRRQHLTTTTTTSATPNDMSWVGQHVHYECECDEAEYVYVKWGDGNTSKVLFQEIAVVTEPIIDKFGEWIDEDGDQENVAAEEDGDINSNAEDDGSQHDDSSDSDSESDSEDDTHTTLTTRINRIGVIIRAVVGLAVNVFSQGWRYLVKSEHTATKSSNNVDMLDGHGDVKVASTAKAGINGGGSDGVRSEDKAEAYVTTGDDKPFSFPQFEIVDQCPSDHHYLDNMEQGTGGRRKWMKRVQKEWKILENNNLPDTIYVRVFEDRMDLLRVAMVGASGTPYHDGLFFFDLQLPPSYPDEPPLANYRSFGLHVNPNLYPSGTVCLSLLNTFGGQDEAELWSPDSSTILQVVVSIQGLVLTAQPYYNEPAWAPAGTPMGQRNEVPYSESTFLQSLQTMLHVMRRPPAGFEEFVRDHFRRRRQHVIRACEAYRDGCIVGTLDEEGNPMQGSTERQSSIGFRIALLNVLPRLVEAFDCIDA